MKVIFNKEVNSKLQNIKEQLEFEKQYDEGIARLHENRIRLQEYKEYRELQNLRSKKTKSNH